MTYARYALAAAAAACLVTACGTSAQSGSAGQSGQPAPGGVTDCRQLPGKVILKALALTPPTHMETSLEKGNCTWSSNTFTLQAVAETPSNEEAGYNLGGSPCPGKPGSLTGNNPVGSPLTTFIAECGPQGVFLHASPTAPGATISAGQSRAVVSITRKLAR